MLDIWCWIWNIQFENINILQVNLSFDFISSIQITIEKEYKKNIKKYKSDDDNYKSLGMLRL